MATFRFNRDYDNLEQVAQYLPRFLEVLAEIEAAGRYRYNDLFKGRIPGIEGPDEDTAIYLLQGLERKRRQDARVAALLADGYDFVEQPADRQRFSAVALVPVRRMGGEFKEYADVRVTLDAYGRPWGLLPKGARTRGVQIGDRRILAKP